MLRYRRIIICAIFLASASDRVLGTPMNNVTDTQIFHVIQGADKFYTKKEKGEIRLHLSPFYQHGGMARDVNGRVVPTGERLGQWNISGLFFGSSAAPKDYTVANYPNLFNAQNALTALSAASIVDMTGNPVVTMDLSKEKLFDADPSVATPDALAYLVGVNAKHEKLGLRGQLSCDFGFGLGVSVKGGIADYKERPAMPGLWSSGNAITNAANGTLQSGGVTGAGPIFTPAIPAQPAATPAVAATPASYTLNPTVAPLNATAPVAIAPAVTAIQQAAVNAIYYVFRPEAQALMFGEVGLDTTEVHDTCLEDTHLQLFWHVPWEMKDRGELTVTTIPYLSIGAWIPTGKIRNQDRAFSIDTGNNGFYALTGEASLAFDFPKLLQTSFGCGALLAASKQMTNYRVPSANTGNPVKQSGFYPWKTTVSITPGLTWYGNASFKADGFSDALSLYFDYIYTYHQQDKIILQESNNIRAAAFAPGIPVLEAQSNWKTQLLNIGLDYRINKNLSFGGAFQAMIGGTRVFKTTTAMGSITLAW